MQHDKKALAGRIRMVLPTRLGAAGIFEDSDEHALRKAIEYLGSP
jgi:3-dehydroquinate synthetase